MNYQNKSEFKNSQDRQYRLSVVKYPDTVITKDDKTNFIKSIQGGYSTDQWSRVNLKQKLKNPKDWNSFMCGHLQNVGYLADKNYLKITTKDESIQADFLFLDFDNKDKDGNKLSLEDGYLSYSKALQILQDSEYNYVLSTSHSHTLEHEKLHILIPVLNSIDSSDLYKVYLNEVHDELFKPFPKDAAVSSIANNKNGGNINTIQVDVEFSKNDFDIKEVDLSTRRTLKKTSSIKSDTNVIQNDKELIAYGKQVNNLYNMRLSLAYSNSNVLKLHRDKNDRVPAVFNVPHNNAYDPSLIFDNITQTNGKRKTYQTMFVQNDYRMRKDALSICALTQSKMTREIDNWFFKGGHKHTFLITNEGLGKSTTVLSLAKKFSSFIYACYTTKKMEETAEYLSSIGIKHYIVLSIDKLLKKENFEHLCAPYEKYQKSVKKPSLKKFLKKMRKKMGLSESEQEKLIEAYHENNEQINKYGGVILMTTAKLKIMSVINQANMMANKHPIVLDEFVDNEWKRVVIDNNRGEKEEPSIVIPETWGEKTNTSNGNRPREFCCFYEDSMFEALECKRVLVLTTERRLVDLFS